MKLHAKLRDPDLLSRICSTVSKITKECIVVLSPDLWRFVLVASDGVQVFAAVAVNMLFEDYLIESLSNNNIYIEISLEQFDKILKYITQCITIEMRLTKRDNVACLAFACENYTQNFGESGKRYCSFSIPINLKSQNDVMSEPDVGDSFDVSITFPSLGQIKGVMDRLKNISDKVTIEASMNGEIKFGVDTTSGSVDIRFSNLQPITIKGKENVPVDVKKVARVVLDIDKFSRFLFCYQIKPTNVVCCMTSNKTFMIYASLDKMSLVYYLPVIYTYM